MPPPVTRSLKEDEVDAWIEHCTKVFKHESPQYFISHMYDDWRALKDLSNVLVAMDNTVIAASVRVIPRYQFIAGRVVKTGGIGEVSTNEAYRGQGLASALLREAINGPLQSYDVSALHTDADRLGHFYGRLDWESVNLEYGHVHLESLLPLVSDLVISPLDISQHADDILAIYHQVSSRFNGPFVRDVHYVQKWIAARHQRDKILAFGAWTCSGKLLGYVFGKESNGKVAVDELIVVDHSPAIAKLLLGQLSSVPLTAKLPLPVAKLYGLPVESTSVDRGFMYRRHKASDNIWSTLMAQKSNHVFWKSDGF